MASALPLEPGPLQFVPLRRALQTATTEPNVVVLSLARTPEREAMFRWLGAVAPYDLWIYRHRTAVLPPVHDAADLRGRGLRFGVQDGSNFHEWLQRQGIGVPPDNSTIDAVPQNGTNIGKAALGRIDLFAHPEISFAYRAAEHGAHAADFVKLLKVDALSTPLWAATGLNTDARLVSALTDALARLRQSGRADRLRQQALREFNALYRL